MVAVNDILEVIHTITVDPFRGQNEKQRQDISILNG
jgi:hypothetical protein